MDTQSTLPFGSPQEVREEVRERIRAFGPGGGFVFNAVHNIQALVPVENVLAMYRAAREYGTLSACAWTARPRRSGYVTRDSEEERPEDDNSKIENRCEFRVSTLSLLSHGTAFWRNL